MRGLILRDRVVVEGAGAVGAAALLASPEGERRLAGRRLAVVVSGRNVDAAVLEHVLGVTR
jgi:threonine dehydratase